MQRGLTGQYAPLIYEPAGESPKALIAAFRNSYNPRIAVTVDMIATGTDIKPLEIVFFMRSVASKNFFEQMKGRGVRVVSDTEMELVNPRQCGGRRTSFAMAKSTNRRHTRAVRTTSCYCKYAAEQDIDEVQALKRGMDGKSKEFVQKATEVYAKE